MANQTPQPKTLWRRILGVSWYALVCVLALGMGSISGWANFDPTLRAIILDQAGIRRVEPKTVFDSTEMTLLVLGCDEDRYYRGIKVLNDAARSDMMLIVKLDFESNRVGGVSIPRDLWVSHPGYRGHKINAYHAIGGPDLTKDVVENLLDVRIDRVLVLNYKAFQNMIDLVGGVSVYVGKKMDYDDNAGDLHIHLTPGRHTLSGVDAMGFIRFRKSDSDFSRIERQRDLMLSFKQSVMSQPAILPAVVKKATELFGGALQPDEVAALSSFMRKIGSDNVKMGTLPVFEGSGTNLNLDGALLQKTLEDHYLKPKQAFPPDSQASTNR